MGKYMKKSKTSADVAVMPSSSSSPIGSRTRLALQKSHSYIQLRSRRLQKLLFPPPPTAAPHLRQNNIVDVETRHRSTGESTPCSLIRDSNVVDTPGSTTRQRTSATSTDQRIHQHMQRNIPTAYEIEEFFSYAEKQQQTVFMDKYNFDVVNDVPLPGRYEWVQVQQ